MHIGKILYIAIFAVLLAACNNTPGDIKQQDALPRIYPDYIGVTIPVGIAPLNFNMADDADRMDVTIKGSKSGELHTNGEWAAFDEEDWRRLTQQNKGGSLTVSVAARKDGWWTRYKDFKIYVSRYALDDYGLTYRRIAPGYEVGGDIGIYQRDLHSFLEEAILTESLVPEQCMNCHTANRADTRQITSQVRGPHGGTIIVKDGAMQILDTKTDSTQAAGSYASWHPAGRYVAYATNSVHQSFYTHPQQPIEVFHKFSNIVVLDTQTNQLICAPQLMTTDALEIFPAFSADGRTLYYSTSAACDVPREYEKVKCSIVAIGFDAATGTFASQTDTLLNGPRDNQSYVLVRPSYDGRWMMYTRADRSNFPIAQPSADLWMMDLKTRKTWPLSTLNSPHTESYHNWSSNSHWVVLSSKREDGSYTRLYLAQIDDKGRASKPFLLPQRNPKEYYHALMDAYNVPDFTRQRVDINTHKLRDMLWSDKRQKVQIK